MTGVAARPAKNGARGPSGAARAGGALLYAPLYLMWPIALLPKALQLVAYALFALVLVTRLGREVLYSYRIGSGAAALLALVGVQAIAVVLNAPESSADRVMAAANTMAIWLISILFLVVYSHQGCSLEVAARAATLNILVCVALALVASRTDASYTLMGDTRRLNLVNWFGGSEGLRFAGFLDYSNLVTLTCFAMLPLSLLRVRRWKGLVPQCAYCLAATYPVVAASSRSGMLLSVALLLISFAFVASGERPRLSVGSLVVLGAVLAVPVLVGSWDRVMTGALGILGGRSGSDATRRELYAASVEDVLVASPLVGRGIKLVDGRFGEAIPLGSHSTYIGILYKTGLLGCLLALGALVGLVREFVGGCLDRRNELFALSFAAVLLVFLAVEDIDGANWAIATVSIEVGMVMGRSKGRV